MASSFDNILPGGSIAAPSGASLIYDPYAELEGHHHQHDDHHLYLSADVLSSVKRSSSYTQVFDHYTHFQPRFVQRRHSLTSICGKGSPIEANEHHKKSPHQNTAWKMVRNFIGHKHQENANVKKKASITSAPVQQSGELFAFGS